MRSQLEKARKTASDTEKRFYDKEKVIMKGIYEE